MTLTTHSVEETLALGRLLGRLAPARMCIALHGPLGAGKTHLTRGIADGAGITDPSLVASPTYVLLNIYEGPKPVYHLDAYRITSEEDFAAIGFEELLDEGGEGVVVIEWAERMTGLLPAHLLEITIAAGETETERTFTLSARGPSAQALADAVLGSWGC